MKKWLAGIGVGLMAVFAMAAYTPVTVDTNTGSFYPPSVPALVANPNALTNVVPLYSSSGVSTSYVSGAKIYIRFNTNTVTGGGTGGGGLSTLILIQSNVASAYSGGSTGYISIDTNNVTSSWANSPAVADANIAGHSVVNVSSLTMTGRVVIGFGVFATTNDVPSPASSNVWYVYAAKVGTTNCLMGKDSTGKITYIGAHP